MCLMLCVLLNIESDMCGIKIHKKNFKRHFKNKFVYDKMSMANNLYLFNFNWNVSSKN